jgi:quinol-cytochrome oxidoreductase complex cytochrome b subunit
MVRRIAASVFPGVLSGKPDRDRAKGLFNSLLLHFRPRRVDARTLRLSLTWGLGGGAAVLVVLLFGSGILLKFAYQPVPEKAYGSILHLVNEVPYGRLVRNVHHWSANGLVLVAVLHLLRVFFTGAFHAPRQFNWVIGLCLFAAVLFSNFTGYLLPWDQLAYWAVTICTGMLDYVPGAGPRIKAFLIGGSELGPDTLSTFFALHTGLMPAVFLALLPFHFWRIRKAGGLVVPRTPEEPQGAKTDAVSAIPHLIVREMAAAAMVTAVVFWLSALADAPLGPEANPGLSPNPTKAPWYFAGFQELLFHFHPVAAVLLPAVLAMGLLCLPYLPYPADTGGIWFASRTGRKSALAAAGAALAVVPAGVLVDGLLVDRAAWLSAVPPVVSEGLLPSALLFAVLAAIFLWAGRTPGAARNDAVQAVFVFLASAWVLLTLICLFFRGTGMALAWPWS